MLISPHNVCGSIGRIACVYLGASILNFDVLEYHVLEVDWWDDLVTKSDPLIEDGHIKVPEVAGLGVELNEEVAQEHAKDEGTMFA